MHRFVRYILVVGMGMALGAAAARPEVAHEGGSPLSLADAIRLGLARNAALQATRSTTEASAADLEIARAAPWPRLFTEVAIHRTDNQVLAFGDTLTAAEFTPAHFAIDALNHPEPVNHGLAAVALELPLYTSGRIRSDIEAASEASLAMAARLRSAEVDLVAEITEAYHGASLSAAAVEVAQSSLQNASDHERLARARYENGAVLKSDFLRAQVHRLASESDLERKRAGLEMVRARLRFLLGVEELPPLALSPAEMEDGVVELGELEDWTGVASTARPEVEADHRAALAADARARAEGASRGPDLSATVRYERNASGFDGGAGSYFAGVGIRWTAFDRGRGARIAASRSRAEAAASTGRATLERARLEVEQAYRDTKVAIGILSTSRQAVAAADEARRIRADRYAAGMLPLTDLLDAEAALRQARLAEIAARFEAVVGRVRLERAAGRLEVPR